MNDINEVILTGRLGKDAQILGQAGNVTKFSIAVSKNSKKVGDKWESETDWINCVLFGNVQLVKGDRVKVWGSWANNNWTDKEGKKHYDHQMVVDQIRVFKKKEKSNDEPSRQYEETSSPQPDEMNGDPMDKEDIPF